MKIRQIATLTLIFLCVYKLSAQVDTEFWFAVGYNTSNSGERDRPINVWISTLDEAATVTISQPANSGFISLEQNVPANSTQMFALTSQITDLQCTSTSGPENKGLYIHSTANVTAYFEQNSISNPDIFSLKGSNALGNEFILPGQTQFYNDYIYNAQAHMFIIVAIYDNTEVTITPKYALKFGHPANVPYTVIMQRGQTLLCQSMATTVAGNLAGSHIKTNGKPIAITINDDSMQTGTCEPDLGGDQIVPIELTGKEYIVTKGFFNEGDRVYITGIFDNTAVNKNGVLWQNIDRGETIPYTFLSSESFIYLSSATQFYVWHVSGFSAQPAAAIIPPIRCTGSEKVVFNRSSVANPSDANFALMVVTQNGTQGDFIVRGSTTLLTASDFSTVPGTGGDWVAARKSFNNTQMPFNTIIDIVNNSGTFFHVGVLNGNDFNSCRYGYFSNYASLNLGSDIESCLGSTTQLDAGEGISFLWSTGATTQTIDVVSGEFWVQVEKEGCGYALRDTIIVEDILPLPDIRITTDGSHCFGEIATLDAGSGFETYEWMDSPLNNTQTFKVSIENSYWVKVTNNYQCENYDTLIYIPKPRPAANPIRFH